MDQPSPPPLPEAFTAILAESLALHRDQLVPTATWESLGLDSLALMQLLSIAEDRLDWELPDREIHLTATHTLADIVRVLSLDEVVLGLDETVRSLNKAAHASR